ncbi:MAG: HNH endonuclease [Nanoarchaeota archaeon]|nr:HNH endonuclease [Nanoarchaeota archaeon]
MPSKKTFNEEDTKKIINFYEEDLFSTKKIGKIFGVREKPIFKVLRKNNINTNIGYRKKRLFASGKLVQKKTQFTEEQIKEIINLYENELQNPTEIGNKFGVSSGPIHRLLIENNINMTQSHRMKKLWIFGKLSGLTKIFSKEQEEEIIRLYCDKKFCLTKIAKLFNVSKNVIKSRLLQKKIHIRGNSEIRKNKKLSIKTRQNMSIARKGNKSAQKYFPDELEIKKIVDLYKKELSLEKVGKIFNWSRSVIRRILRENNIPVLRKGKIPWNKDKPYLQIALEKHHNWNSGSSFEPYDKFFNDKFKRAIRKRDNQVCMACGIHREKLSRALDIHHISYDKLVSIPQNCISLCSSCHMKTNYNREHWIKFFQSLLAERYKYEYSENQDIIFQFKNEKTKDL